MQYSWLHAHKIQVTIDDIYVLCVYLLVLVFILIIISWDVYALLSICGPQHYSMIVLRHLFNTMDSFLNSFENLWLLMFYFSTADSLRNLQPVGKHDSVIIYYIILPLLECEVVFVL